MLSTLISGAQRTVSDQFQILTVAQPAPSLRHDLPGALEEVNNIRARAEAFTVLELTKFDATPENVLAGLESSSWAHFACHGIQDLDNPMKSGLLLAGDRRLELSDVTKLSLPNADLAFLSACQTATGDGELPDEAIHLAAGMLLIGYRGVIATMWSIEDGDAVLVSDNVYTHLFKTPKPDSTQAAYALHRAVRHLREDLNAPFRSWVPFIHIGV